MQIALRTAGEPESIAPFLRSVVRRLDSNVPVAGVLTMNGAIKNTLSDRYVVTALLAGFTFLAVLLASIGLYGLLSFQVGRRTHEIGIRLALGAGRSQILGMILGHGMRLAGAGLLFGSGAAFVSSRWLGALLFGKPPTDAPTFVACAILFLFVAVLACWIPARRAMLVDPAISLRAD